MSVQDLPRPRDARHARRAAPLLLVLATLVPLACGPALPSATPAPSPDDGARPSASPAASAGPGSPPAADAWEDLGNLPPLATVATLTPERGGSAPIAADAAFEMGSVGNVPAAVLAARLTVEPATALTISPGRDAAHVLVRPVTPFPAGSLVRFRLAAADGTLAGSWAYEIDRAPRVVAVLPRQEASEVPVSTGVEVAFDQDGVVVTAADFTIAPAVTGRVETNGRVVAFVPTALEPDTVYTVTLRAGVGRPGSPYVLEEPVRWQFETAAAGAGDLQADAWLQAGRVTTTPRGRALLLVDRSEDEGVAPVAGGDVTVHRLPDRDAALEIGQRLSATRYLFSSGRHVVVSTDGLPVVLQAAVTFREVDGVWMPAVRLPRRLPIGFYVVTLVANGRPSQAVLQVTDLAPFALVTTTRTLAWVNDVVRRTPVSGTRVLVAGGPSLGRTDARGIVDATTPAALLAGDEGDDRWEIPTDTAPPTLLLDAADGRRAYLVLDEQEALVVDRVAEGSRASAAGDPAWWAALATDRLRYRSSDTIDAWGVLRARADLDVPATAVVRLVVEEGGAVVASSTARPDARGAFAVQLPVRDVPAGWYAVELVVGSRVVRQAGVEIGVIRTPAYRLRVTADRWAMLAGRSTAVAVAATFYEGTPAAGIDVRLAVDDGPTATITTGADGTARTSSTIGIPTYEDEVPRQVADREILARPTAPEEGSIEASTNVIVFRGTRLVDAAATVRGTALVATGAVHVADIARLNRLPSLEAALDADPRGRPIAGARVRLAVVERWTVRVRTGTAYDPITKQAAPVYEMRERERALRPVTVRTRGDGTYRARVAVRGGDRWYDVTATTVDPGGREVAERAWAAQQTKAEVVPLSLGEVTGDGCPVSCRVGDVYTVPLVGAGPLPSGGANRYLFLVEQEGLRRWTLSASPTHDETFRASDVPNVVVHAVWFDGRRYVVPYGSLRPAIAPAARTLRVAVTADRDRYQPGATARVQVRVTDRAGRPAAATVVVAIVDRRLLDATGGAPIGDPRELLYATLGDGVEALVAHPAWPDLPTDGKGATGGSEGERSDFRDALLFTTVATGPDGMAEIPVELSDDLTSWRVAAGAVDGRLRGGLGTADLRVGLPFFAEATVAAEYLAADRPAVQVRAFGTAVAAAAPVTFTVRSDTLPMAAASATGPAASGVVIPLATLTPGIHRLTITADDGRHRDTVVRSFRVVETRRTRPVLRAWTVTDALRPTGAADGLSTFIVSDAGRGAWVPRLYALAAEPGARGDQAVAARAAVAMLAGEFGVAADALPTPPALEPFLRDDGALAVLAYGAADLELTVRSLLADPSVAGRSTAGWLHGIVDDDPDDGDEADTPERRSVALVGLAALGEPVLERIRDRLGAADVTPRETLWLGLGAAALGDATTATAVARHLAARFGERSGILVRLAVSEAPNQVAEATAQFAALAAAVGDPLAEPALAYVAEHPRTDDLAVLEEVLTIRGLVAHLAPEPTVLAWSVDGATTRVDLADGRAVAVTVTPAQRATLVFEALEGRVAVVGRWDEAGAPVGPAARAVITRTAAPAGDIARTSLVRVRITARFTGSAPETYRVVELVPSGLVPVEPAEAWYAEDDGDDEDGVARCEPPSLVDGQRVEFSTGHDPTHTERLLCYLARVVTPGEYRWEPATITLAADPSTWFATDTTTVTIR